MVTINSANNKTATSGKVLQGQGVGTASDFSTATYPSTSGTSGNVLTSDGTNWVSSPAVVLRGSVTLTSAQVKALHGTPITVAPAPGAGKALRLISAMSRMNYGGSNVFVAGASQASTLIQNSSIVASQTLYDSPSASSGPNSLGSKTAASMENLGLVAYNGSPTEISGNAANNNTITIDVIYYVFPVS